MEETNNKASSPSSNTRRNQQNSNPPTKSKRVVSLLGAATETLYRLGVGDQLVGRSHECDYPPAIRSVPCISTARLDVSNNTTSRDIDTAVQSLSAAGEPVYELDGAMIQKLQPNLIIAQDQCRVCAITPADVLKQMNTTATCSLMNNNIPQLVLRPATLQDCWNNITQIAEAMGVPERGKRLLQTLQERLQRIDTVVKSISSSSSSSNTPRNKQDDCFVLPRVALLEWCDPIMGCGYWLPELVQRAGGQPLHCPPPGGATPTLSFETLMQSRPNVVIFALCGFSLSRAAQEIQNSWSREQLEQLLLQTTQSSSDAGTGHSAAAVYIVDGNYLINRSGPRLVESCEALAEAIHPELQGHFGHIGTNHLCSLEFALSHLVTAATENEEEPAVSENNADADPPTRSSASAPMGGGIPPVLLSKSWEESSTHSSVSGVLPLRLPKTSPSAAIAEQLDCLLRGDMPAAFDRNSQANQHRWGSAERFAQVLQSHATFSRLLSEPAKVKEEVIQDTIATGVVYFPNDPPGPEMVWTMIAEKARKSGNSVGGDCNDDEEHELVWRTEKVSPKSAVG